MAYNKQLTDFEKLLDFQKIADSIAQKGDGRFHSKTIGKYSPTELTGCVRNSFYNRKYPVPYDDRAYRIFLLGNIIHDLYQNNLNDPTGREKIFGKDFANQIDFLENEKGFHYLVPLEKSANERIVISGRPDTIIYLKDNPVPIVVDYKTVSNLSYVKNNPKQDHIDQLNFYLGCTLGEYGIIPYVNKNDLNVIQHTIKYSPDTFNKIVDFAVNLHSALKTDVIPQVNVAEFSKNGYCRFCPHKTKCGEYEHTKEN